ncbi:polysaccharide deacetylase family protein [Niabella sp. CJ426]|uniref:polysaccharide deacetylase family protein n=1 Tax=Niabella sp. CJ426 TaxID=3393740 RepID=UPI003D02344E
MLTFRNTNIVFVVLLSALIVLDLQYEVPVLSYILLAISYSLILFYGSYFVHSQFYMKAICKADTVEKKIALTFDDGPLNNYTPQILSILEACKVRATFFCIGKNAAMHADLLKQVHEQGHIIGSHSYSHGFWFDLLSSKKMEADLQQAHHLFQNELGLNVKWFRPPYGVTNPNLKKAVERMGYTAIGWNVRSMDTVAKDDQGLLNKLKQSLKPGGIFLFHDTMAVTVSVLADFIIYAQQQGYEITPLDKLLNLQPYAD